MGCPPPPSPRRSGSTRSGSPPCRTGGTRSSTDGRSPSYGHYFAAEFTGVFERLGAHPRIYRTSEMYRSGQFDEAIRAALDQVQAVREIYREVTHSARVDDRWWPIQVLCERCG